MSVCGSLPACLRGHGHSPWGLYLLLSTLAVFALTRGGAQRCGNEDRSGPIFTFKIAGGQDAEFGRYPYIASLQEPQSRTHFCTGTLIRNDMVLTAAHCVFDRMSANEFPVVQIGGNLRAGDDQAEVRDTCRIILHIAFDPSRPQAGNDIALLQLASDSSKRPCAVGSGRGPEEVLKALGWGRDERGIIPRKLREVELDTVPVSQCANFFRITELSSLLCANRDGNDVCRGDSGGPILRAGSGCGEDDEVLGLTSVGQSCINEDTGLPNPLMAPGVFTRTSFFQGWIEGIGAGEAKIAENEQCSRPLPRSLGTDETNMPTAPVVDLPSTRESNGCTLVEGINFSTGPEPLNDGSEDIVSSPEECCTLCKNTAGCRAWTFYVLDERTSPRGSCWLRDIVAPASRCSICVSGLVRKDLIRPPVKPLFYFLGMDFFGADLASQRASGLAECSQICLDNEDCKSFTYQTEQGRCFLKSGTGELTICQFCQSGLVESRVETSDPLDILFELLPGVEKQIQDLRLTAIPGLCRLTVGADMLEPNARNRLNDGTKTIVRTPEECCKKCSETSGCKSWTMATVPTRTLPRGACFLRRTIPPEVPCAGCTSGSIEGQGASGILNTACGVLEGIDLFGNDIGEGVKTDSPKECCELCGRTDGCKSWTRVKTRGLCFLKSTAVSELEFCAECDSGIQLDKVTQEEIEILNPIVTKS